MSKKTTPKKTKVPVSRARRRVPVAGEVDPETKLELFRITRDDLKNELEAFVESLFADKRRELEVFVGQAVAQQVAALAQRADQEAETERLNYFAARAMVMLSRHATMPLAEGVREEIARQSYEMARAMVEHSRKRGRQ